MRTAENEQTLLEQLRQHSLNERTHVLKILVADLQKDAEGSISSESLRRESSQRLRSLVRELDALERVLKHCTKVTKLLAVRESA